MSLQEFADGNKSLKKFTIPIKGSMTILALDVLDAMKAVDEALKVAPYQWRIRPEMHDITIEEVIKEEE